ncbi:MAG: glucose 1-dehydrogenase [Steroidobacteraceae bacterium]|nr:glucose 1-dehydrogenase [Steroidobacteraceae bacterium]MBP7012679.1 glucose 1-dehydrogenase [Steroidobacteraceae bacterium]
MTRLAGKIAIVTGAARGMGAAISRRFAEEGATVALTDVLPEVDATAQAIGPAATAYRHDVSDESRWQEVVDAVVARHGRIDVLVNNAGILVFKDLLATSAADLRRILDVNAVGTFIGMRTVAPHMIRQGSGSIVNNSSCDGISPANSLIAYASSKFAVRGMTKVAALELGPHGVRVNSVHPGGINTPMVNPQGAPADALNRGMSWFPAQRLGDPVEAANCFVFLASDESSFCMGTELTVDGGLIAGHYYYGLPGAPAGILPPGPAPRKT